MRQPGHGPGCSVAKPSRTHSFTALVDHTRQVPPARQALPLCELSPKRQFDVEFSPLNLPEVHHETDGSERIEHEDTVLSRGRISACVHKRHSEQSRAGVTDESFGVAAVGLEHLERLVPSDIRDLDQVRASRQRLRSLRWRPR